MMKMDIEVNHDNNNMRAAYFSVVFYDGEREIDLGTILITSVMNFKGFQSLISQKIGISPHQITTYFTPIHHNTHRRRHPVTNKFNFSAAIHDANTSFFWVVLKRSRRVRRRKPRLGPTPDDNFVLARRNPDFDYVDHLNRLKLLDMEKERYLMSLNLNSNVYSDLTSGTGGYYSWGYYHNHNNNNSNQLGLSSDDGASSSGAGSETRAFCQVCLGARFDGHETVPFHCCKNDAVTKVFRSPAGPIGPPVRKDLC